MVVGEKAGGCSMLPRWEVWYVSGTIGAWKILCAGVLTHKVGGVTCGPCFCGSQSCKFCKCTTQGT